MQRSVRLLYNFPLRVPSTSLIVTLQRGESKGVKGIGFMGLGKGYEVHGLGFRV
jgi:hypothetical protein